MRTLARWGVAAAFGAAGLAVVATSASAAVVCNRKGACWHVRHPYRYDPAWGLVVHPNSWRWAPGSHYVWREHRGRGYWRKGVWVTF